MKDTDRTLTITDAKRDLLNLVKKVQEYQESVLLTRNGYPAVVILSVDEYEGLLETIEILSDPQTMKTLQKSLTQLEKGQVLSEDEVWRE